MAVNVSARQFRDKNLAMLVARVLRETGLEARYLELELTESLLMHNAEEAITLMQALKTLGVRLAIDDFGTGYSSLAYLKRFPVDRLKIDQSFVQEISTNTDNAVIVRAVISLGHSLNMDVIAEGVESQAQLEFLHAHHCDEVQGYYFSRPVPSEQCVEAFTGSWRISA
jgi:EAL domain-containing protein (putative c-di-GMP-specific phosphodiesterase class I)